ncbi:D-Ala-D-Ala carboxypeptidase family metallohydrolase [Paraburkholderia sp. J69-1]|uniref:D-Ala-D-Ala carboxypeptidase family metallohydrolase n=1 Tax=Paraburkholderia sp. J69-1 TaxID=2805436 RepID=UPI002AB67697|nr:D-Ala-D-Ala carboxypeptidase family metallohydrolase [Paraburkholderia sp. J69-1]
MCTLLVGKPILISSAFRSRAVNKAVGGVPNSAHALGFAADFISPPDRHAAPDLHGHFPRVVDPV